MKSVIFGIKGTTLTDDEKEFFHQANPVGFILFARNLETITQVKTLIQQLKEITGRDRVPILIDQEGGRVQRIGPKLGYIKFPPAKIFGDIVQKKDLESAKKLCHDNYRILGLDLSDLGINIDCAPCIDLFYEVADKVIGDRSFSSDPKIVSSLGQAAISGLKESGIMPIIKHIPGHGRALVDSHYALPQVNHTLAELEFDFAPFRELSLNAEIAMTAHICYTAIDSELPLTLSSKAIDFVRQDIGFKGILISDDLSMKALSGNPGELAEQAYKAGCDLLLHCNGNLEEMQQIAAIDIPINHRVQNILTNHNSTFAQIINNQNPKIDKEVLLSELKKKTDFDYAIS
jgi:beta-N-acetylhexosaminidase